MKYKKTRNYLWDYWSRWCLFISFFVTKGYKVIGVTRNKSNKNLYRLKKLNVVKKITLLKGVATDLKFCEKSLNSKVNEIYYLAGESSVIKSFETPEISLKSNTNGILNILQTLNEKSISQNYLMQVQDNFMEITKKIFITLILKLNLKAHMVFLKQQHIG